jgi:hypothetical protein
VLEQDEEVVRVGGRLHETEPLVEGSRVVILGVHGARALTTLRPFSMASSPNTVVAKLEPLFGTSGDRVLKSAAISRLFACRIGAVSLSAPTVQRPPVASLTRCTR